jgi:hypothetical protein
MWNASAFRRSGTCPVGTEFTCALCGARFTHGEEVCGTCPLAAGCDLVRCPACGYQFPRRSALADAWKRLAARWRRKR